MTALHEKTRYEGKLIPAECPVLQGYKPGFTNPACKVCIHWVKIGKMCTVHNLPFEEGIPEYQSDFELDRIPKDTKVNTLTSFRLSKQTLAEVKQLVEKGIYSSCAEVYRQAITNLLLLEQYETLEP